MIFQTISFKEKSPLNYQPYMVSSPWIYQETNWLGAFTPKIGQLASLEVLDLSYNHLSGEIPVSLVDLNSLRNLDLSNNHFSGEIPKGTQLQGFNASVYMGNPELCGLPLPICSKDYPPHSTESEDSGTHQDENGEIFPGLYVSVVLGFITGFWRVCGTLVLKRSWRLAFFRFFEDLKDKLYVMVYVSIAKIRGSFGSSN